MSLKDTLPTLLEVTSKKPNVVQRWLDTLPQEERELALRYMAMTAEEVSTLSLLRALKEEGAPFGKEALRMYRAELWKNNVSK